MHKRIGLSAFLTAATMAAALTTPLCGEVVCDHSYNDLADRFNPGLLEIGDEITLGGSGRVLINSAAMDFATRIEAVPEASSAAILFLGLTGLVLFHFWRRPK